jgi:hypothetical protein
MRFTVFALMLASSCVIVTTDDSSDATTTSATDSSTLSFTGTVTNPTYATESPLSSNNAGSGVTVQYVYQGATQSTTSNSSGQFTVTAIDIESSATWFALTNNTGCSNVGVNVTSTGTQTAVLPIYDSTLVSSLAYTLSGLESVTTTSTATVILQFVDATTLQPVAGITASSFGGQIPFYDTGVQNSYGTTLGTGSFGTIVFVGVDPTQYNGSDVQFQIGDSGSQSTPSLMLTANCVTYLMLYVS